MAEVRPVLVPAARLERWVENFATRHGDVALRVEAGALCGNGTDGAGFVATLPFSRDHRGAPGAAEFARAMTAPGSWGVLLVRRGGFAVARLQGGALVEHKIGQRHVQGRTKAGGQSQQRFARRRDNQARQAFEAAADHAARILRPGPLVVGGDRQAVSEVLADPRLSDLEVVGHWQAVPDPKRRVLDQVIDDAQAARIEISDP